MISAGWRSIMRKGVFEADTLDRIPDAIEYDSAKAANL
jgi:hypothetical protein